MMDERQYSSTSGTAITSTVLLLISLFVFLLAACSTANLEKSTDSNHSNAAHSQSSTKSDTGSGGRAENGLLYLELIGYENAIKTFREINSGEAQTKINAGDCFFLFVGRSTCEWCRRLAPSVQEVFTKKNIEVFYIDSSETDIDSRLNDFRIRYHIDTVPSILFFANNGSYSKVSVDLAEPSINSQIERQLELLGY